MIQKADLLNFSHAVSFKKLMKKSTKCTCVLIFKEKLMCKMGLHLTLTDEIRCSSSFNII